jgi:hypothetical protein
MLSQAADAEYHAWLDGLRDQMVAEDALQPESPAWALTRKGQEVAQRLHEHLNGTAAEGVA